MPRLQSFPILQCSYFRLRTVSDVPFTPLSHFHSLTSSSCWWSLPLPYRWQLKILLMQVSTFFIQCSNSEQSHFVSKNQFFFLDSEWNQKLVYFDYGFTCVFAIEVLMKIIDYGVILHPGSYLRELWNVMDMLVVSCAISSFTMDML